MADRPLAIERLPLVLLGAGNHIVVPSKTGYRVVVVAAVLSTTAGNVLVSFRDENGSSLMDVYLLNNSSAVLSECTAGWVATDVDKSLILAIGAAGGVSGVVIYRYVPNHVVL